MVINWFFQFIHYSRCYSHLFFRTFITDKANIVHFVLLRVSYWGHKISKSTSVDCNKINVVMVKVRIMWESPGKSHAIAIQWVHMVKDPLATILHVHT